MSIHPVSTHHLEDWEVPGHRVAFFPQGPSHTILFHHPFSLTSPTTDQYARCCTLLPAKKSEGEDSV